MAKEYAISTHDSDPDSEWPSFLNARFVVLHLDGVPYAAWYGPWLIGYRDRRNPGTLSVCGHADHDHENTWTTKRAALLNKFRAAVKASPPLLDAIGDVLEDMLPNPVDRMRWIAETIRRRP